jgi:hypothetical protein
MDVEAKTIPAEVVPPPPHEAAPRRPSALAYFARRASGEWRRFRQGFTRQNVISFSKAMAWVVPLTLLIWVYAETAQDVPRSNVQMPIELRSNDPKLTVKLVKPYPDKFIVCDLEGPSSNLEHFTDQLSPTDPLIINIDTSKLPPGENSMPTKGMIIDNPRLKAYGISVNKSEPDVLTFDVDQLDERSATVTAPTGIPTLKSATFDPPTIRVSGPKHELDAAETNGELTVVADITSLSVLSSPGQHEVSNVNLRQVDDLNYSRDKVRATLVVTDPDVPYTLSNVPVLLTASYPVLRDNAVTWDASYSAGINVIGPPDKIAQLKAGQVNPYLELKIASTDVSNPRPIQLQLRDLPEGVRVAPGQTLTESFTAAPR